MRLVGRRVTMKICKGKVGGGTVVQRDRVLLYECDNAARYDSQVLCNVCTYYTRYKEEKKWAPRDAVGRTEELEKGRE